MPLYKQIVECQYNSFAFCANSVETRFLIITVKSAFVVFTFFEFKFFCEQLQLSVKIVVKYEKDVIHLAEPKVWLITGTSTGFGRQLVEALQQTDAKIAATARNVEKIANWKGNDNIMPLTLDVTNQSQIDEAIKATLAKFGRIDVLVNNAGWGYFGSVEEGEIDVAHQLMDTNFWGLVNVTRAVLPTMRKQKSGNIINISSVAGILSGAGLGFYNATKHAVEGLTKALYQEVEPLGIHVTNIEPGPFRTDWAGRSHRSAPANIADYDDTAHQTVDKVEGFSGTQDGSPELLAQAIIKISNSPKPPLHFLAGTNAFERAHDELEQEEIEFDTWEEDSTHLYYGDEQYWNL